MGDSLVPLTYGKALYDAAKEGGMEERIGEELKVVTGIIRSEDGLRRLLGNPTVTAEEKKELVRQIFAGHVYRELVNFLYVLIDKGRTGCLAGAAKQYRLLYEQDRGLAHGKVISAVPLSEAQVSEAGRQISGLLQKEITLENSVDPSVIGGIKIQVEGKMIDLTLRHELEQMRLLLQNSQEVEV